VSHVRQAGPVCIGFDWSRSLHSISLGDARRQVEALRCDIRRREWEDAARKALAGKSSLTALQEALSDAPTMSSTDSPLLKALRCRPLVQNLVVQSK
jgi:hypothetical protein